MKAHRRVITLAVFWALLVALAAPITALAHPLGNFTVNRYSRLELSRDRVRVRYVVDMAEIPAFQARARIDVNGDGTLDAAEQDRYLSDQIAAVLANLRLIVNDEALALQAHDAQIDFAPGQGGLSTLRISVWLTAWLPAGETWQLDYEDGNFAARPGWKEIVVAAQGVNVLAASAPARDLSDELRAYPQDLLQSPPDVSHASIRFEAAVDGVTDAAPVAEVRRAASAFSRGGDQFAQLIAIPELGLGAIVAALIGAFVWGAAHAFSPGHGKTVVAAYLVGARATARHALFLGATTTVTHTAGVFTLGLVTLFASQYVVPEQLYPWLEAGSGALLAGLGLSMFAHRVRRLRQAAWHEHHHHDHDHDHGHDHGHVQAHDHDHDHHHSAVDHSHLPPGAHGTPVTWRSLLALGISGGLLPCPSALVVMLGAIALNRIAFGLLLIGVFSLGLAGTLTAIGIMMVRAKSWIERAGAGGRLPIGRRAIQIIPAVSALFIMLAGVGLIVAALAQAGVIGA